MHAKLFYNSFLRYMIVSNLKLTYTVWGFFMLTFGVFLTKFPQYGKNDEFIRANIIEIIKLVCGVLAILFLIVYPLATMFYLLKN